MYEIGQQVSYVLRPKDLPVDPDFENHGVILAIDGRYIKVQLTDPPYEGDIEWIEEGQIRSVGEQKGEQKAFT